MNEKRLTSSQSVKSPGRTLIGIDLDNTLVCYDELFHFAAHQEGLIELSSPKNKERIRDTIRLLPQGESQWTRLQAIVYGPRMSAATAFEGSEDFLRHCAERGTKALIVSHKTHFATLDGQQVDLRESALTWMKAKKFFDPDGCGLSPDDVFFESTRSEKIERIRALGCTHFIDDLAEVFAESSFPRERRQVTLRAPRRECAQEARISKYSKHGVSSTNSFSMTSDAELEENIRDVLRRDLNKEPRAFQN